MIDETRLPARCSIAALLLAALTAWTFPACVEGGGQLAKDAGRPDAHAAAEGQAVTCGTPCASNPSICNAIGGRAGCDPMTGVCICPP